MRRNFMEEFGEKLVDCGYPIIPIWPGAKCPGRFRGGHWQGYPDWSAHGERSTKSFELSIWRNWPGCGIGVACGRVGALDIDLLDAELVGEIEAIARAKLGDTDAWRVGRIPKKLLVYRQATPFGKMPRHPLEWLGRGSQFVAYGIHPDTQEPYRWLADELFEVTVNRLPTVTEEQVVRFMDRAGKLIPPDQRVSRLGPDRSAEHYITTGGDLRGTREATAEALAHIPNDDLPRTDWILVGQAIKGALGEDGRDLWLDWSSSAPKSGKSGKTDTAERTWKSLKGDRKGFGSLYYYASQHGWSPDPLLIFNATKAEALATVDLSGFNAPAVAPRHELPVHDFETGEVPEQDRTLAESAVVESRGITLAGSAGVESQAVLPTNPAPDPGGVLAEITDWIVETSSQPHPNLAMQAAAALVGFLAAHKYRLVHGGQDTRTNVMMVGIAESSSGKDHARRCVKAILNRIGMAEFYGEGFASGQAIEAAFVRRAARLYMVDEFGLLVEAALSRNGNPNLRRIIETITRLATSAAGMFKPADRAEARDVEREVPLTWDPLLTMIATTVEEPLWRALSSSNVSDGSLARYLITRTEPFPDIRPETPHFEDKLEQVAGRVLTVLVGPSSEVSEVSIARAVGALLAPITGEGGRQVRGTPRQPTPLSVPLSEAAKRRLDEIQLEQLALQRRHHAGHTHGIVGRLKEHVARLALIAGISANPKSPTVELDHVAWGESVAKRSINIMLEAAERHIADSDHQRSRNGVLADIARLAGPKNSWVKRQDLTRYGTTARTLDAEQRIKALRDLLEMELIEEGQDKGVGRKAIFYRLVK